MAKPKIYPLNDLVLKVTLKKIDTITGKAVALETGTVRAFIATSKSPTANPADGTLDVTAIHTTKGVWLVTFQGATLTPSLLAGLFGGGTIPYVIVEVSGDIRRYIECEYIAEAPATVN